MPLIYVAHPTAAKNEVGEYFNQFVILYDRIQVIWMKHRKVKIDPSGIIEYLHWHNDAYSYILTIIIHCYSGLQNKESIAYPSFVLIIVSLQWGCEEKFMAKKIKRSHYLYFPCIADLTFLTILQGKKCIQM
jgi:hypothetical protein